MIRLAFPSDLPQILSIYAYARGFMASHGNPHQWGSTRPTQADISAHIDRKELYVLEENGVLHGVFAFILGIDPTYLVIENGSWLSDEPYGTIHAVASDGRIHGLLTQIVAFCETTLHHLRIDTHPDNLIMQHVISKNGFTKCGIIHVADGSARIAYERI